MGIDIVGLLVSFGLLLLAMTVHEFAHGWVAYRLGDTTAKSQGRLSLNPLAHIDPVGTILLPLFLYITTQGRFVFGSAKPVPINYYALRNPSRDMMLIGAAGPGANFLFALVCSLIYRFLPLNAPAQFILENLVVINAVLGVFNLIPIPPLDGSRILMGLLPRHLAYQFAAIEPYGFFILMALVFLGVLNIFVWPVVSLIVGLLLG